MTQEQLRMQMLAGIITEGQYKVKLNEVTVGDFYPHLVNLLNTDKELREQLAIALDTYEDEITTEFKYEILYKEPFITGDNLLISDDEYVIRREAEEMETEYNSMELNIPEVGERELYYIYDPNA